MSWNAYIDSVVGSAKGSCDAVAIIGLKGGASWTTSEHQCHAKHDASEAKVIADALADDNPSEFAAKGIIFNGEKYQFLRYDEDQGVCYGKKKDKGSLTIHKCNTAIVIGHTMEGKAQGDTNDAVSKIIEYLKGNSM